MIFKRGKKRDAEPEAVELDETTEVEATDPDPAVDAGEPVSMNPEAALVALDDLDWRADGPWDITEVDDLENTDDGPRIDLGGMILTGVPGSELRLQISEETQQVVSAMLVLEITLEAPADAASGGAPRVQTVSSALELGAYAAPRSGGLWAELRDEISDARHRRGRLRVAGRGPVRRRAAPPGPGAHPGRRARATSRRGCGWPRDRAGCSAASSTVRPPSRTTSNRRSSTMLAAAFRQVVVRRGDEADGAGRPAAADHAAELHAAEPTLQCCRRRRARTLSRCDPERRRRGRSSHG